MIKTTLTKLKKAYSTISFAPRALGLETNGKFYKLIVSLMRRADKHRKPDKTEEEECERGEVLAKLMLATSETAALFSKGLSKPEAFQKSSFLVSPVDCNQREKSTFSNEDDSNQNELNKPDSHLKEVAKSMPKSDPHSKLQSEIQVNIAPQSDTDTYRQDRVFGESKNNVPPNSLQNAIPDVILDNDNFEDLPDEITRPNVLCGKENSGNTENVFKNLQNNAGPVTVNNLVKSNCPYIRSHYYNGDNASPAIKFFASYDKTKKPPSTDTDSTLDELAKHCLDTPNNKIDERLLKEMKKLGVPPISPRSEKSVIEENIMDVLRKPRRPTEKTEIDVETRKFEYPPLNYSDEQRLEFDPSLTLDENYFVATHKNKKDTLVLSSQICNVTPPVDGEKPLIKVDENIDDRDAKNYYYAKAPENLMEKTNEPQKSFHVYSENYGQKTDKPLEFHNRSVFKADNDKVSHGPQKIPSDSLKLSVDTNVDYPNSTGLNKSNTFDLKTQSKPDSTKEFESIPDKERMTSTSIEKSNIIQKPKVLTHWYKLGIKNADNLTINSNPEHEAELDLSTPIRINDNNGTVNYTPINKEGISFSIADEPNLFPKRSKDKIYTAKVYSTHQDKVYKAKVNSTHQDKVYTATANSTPQDNVYIAKVYSTPQDKVYKAKVNSTPQDKVYTATANSTPQDKVYKAKVNSTPQDEVYTATVNSTPQDKVYTATDNCTPLRNTISVDFQAEGELAYSEQFESKNKNIVNEEQEKRRTLEKKMYDPVPKIPEPLLVFNHPEQRSAKMTFHNKQIEFPTANEDLGTCHHVAFVQDLKSLRIRCNMLPTKNTDEKATISLLVEIDAIKQAKEDKARLQSGVTYREDSAEDEQSNNLSIPSVQKLDHITQDKATFILPAQKEKLIAQAEPIPVKNTEMPLSAMLKRVRERNRAEYCHELEQSLEHELDEDAVTGKCGDKAKCNPPQCPKPKPKKSQCPPPMTPPPVPPACPRPCKPMSPPPCPPPCPRKKTCGQASVKSACPGLKKKTKGNPCCPGASSSAPKKGGSACSCSGAASSKNLCRFSMHLPTIVLNSIVSLIHQQVTIADSELAQNHFFMVTKKSYQRILKSACFSEMDRPRLLPILNMGGYELSLVNYESMNSLLARDYDPWVPIPCWPLPKKVAKRPYPCPKGCPIPLPGKNRAPCEPYPCRGFPKRKNSFSIIDLYACWYNPDIDHDFLY